MDYEDFNEYDCPETDDAEQYEMNCLAEDACLEAEEDFPEDDWEYERYQEPDFF